MSDQNKTDLPELIGALLDGTLTEQQFQKLSQYLQEDPAARELYLEDLEIESALRNLSSLPDRNAIFPAVTTVNHSSSLRWILPLLVLLAISVATGYLLRNGGAPNPKVAPTANAPNRSVARITNGKNLVWQKDKKRKIGSWIKPGLYELASGDLEITFDSGAVAYISGSSRFAIIDDNTIRLLRGSLEADVPEQAIGFTVKTPSGEIIDLSTKFGVKVSEKGESDVHVIKGLVEAKPVTVTPTEQRILTLKENSAIRMFPDAPPKTVEFLRPDEIEFGSRSEGNQLNYVHFSFDEEEVQNGVIANSGPGGNGQGGKIVTGVVPNSWVQVDGPFNKAIFLSGEGAKIASQIQGVSGNQARTLMFWVRISPETPIRSAYSFASWGRSGKAVGHKWQIGWNPNYQYPDEGVMGAIRTEFGGGYVIGSTDLRDGRWHHVASVFLGGGKKDDVSNLIRHYVDGKLESISGYRATTTISTESDRRTLTVGEYIGMGENFFTGYKGWIDEFYLFDEALTPSQIVQVMEQNQPPSADEIVVVKPDE